MQWENFSKTFVIKCMEQENSAAPSQHTAETGGLGGGAKRRFMDALKEDIKFAGAREEGAEDRVRWRKMIG